MESSPIQSETWKSIEGTEGQYEVSDCGRVRSLTGPGGEPEILSVTKNAAGYHIVAIRANGRATTRNIARLVACAFLGPPPGRPSQWIVQHRDGDRDNIRIENLEWVSRREKNQRMAESGRNAILNPDKVKDIRRRHDSGESITEIAKSLEVRRATVAAVISRTTWAWVP